MNLDDYTSEELLKDLADIDRQKKIEEERANLIALRKANNKADRRKKIRKSVSHFVITWSWFVVSITIFIGIVMLIGSASTSDKKEAEEHLDRQKTTCVQVGGRVIDDDICYFPAQDKEIRLG
jgi:hypothetical protein